MNSTWLSRGLTSLPMQHWVGEQGLLFLSGLLSDAGLDEVSPPLSSPSISPCLSEDPGANHHSQVPNRERQQSKKRASEVCMTLNSLSCAMITICSEIVWSPIEQPCWPRGCPWTIGCVRGGFVQPCSHHQNTECNASHLHVNG